ncbi:hypothetical protein QAD02_009900 [Eretmocerus hayati]|uniref:Uncharacterized protein n=1 Tax=Eretmocerus hayati TaxID=131215 RepID=A0ACC2NAP6_9HYME|nr:hypothetical protein QAD02_009900 [Eretmocerus hayati]
MINLKSCIFLACLLSTFGSVFPNPIGSSAEVDGNTTWTKTGKRVDGDKLVIDEEVVVFNKDQENTFYMPEGDEFTAVEIWYPKGISILLGYPLSEPKYKYTIQLEPENIPAEGLKYKIKVYAKPIVCPDGTEDCKKYTELIRQADIANDEKNKLKP